MNKVILTLVIFFSFQVATYAQRAMTRPDKIGIGLGPSYLYGDNTGVHSDFQFRILPTASVDFTKYLDTHFDIRGTLGWQRIGSGDFYNESQIRKIAEASYPHAFLGNVVYADVMPTYIVNPDRRGFLPSLLKIYGGLGIGIFHSFRTDEFRTYEGDIFTTETEKGKNTGIYFPIRIGTFMEIPEINGEIGLESAMLISPFANMEGNSQQQKRIAPDIAVQLQVFYRLYLW